MQTATNDHAPRLSNPQHDLCHVREVLCDETDAHSPVDLYHIQQAHRCRYCNMQKRVQTLGGVRHQVRSSPSLHVVITSVPTRIRRLTTTRC